MLKAILLSCALGVLTLAAQAQTNETTPTQMSSVPADSLRKMMNKPGVFTAVERMAEFPGGTSAFVNYIAANLRYPKEARDNKVQGKVIVVFTVESDGYIRQTKVIKSLSKELDEEAERVLKESPQWKPCIQNGKPVRVQLSIPITFSL